MNQAGSAPIEEIKAVLLRFQEGYLQRDAAALDEFMQLFSSNTELEVIGTGGIYPGDDEWCCGPAVRELVKNDWEGWGIFGWKWSARTSIYAARLPGALRRLQ